MRINSVNPFYAAMAPRPYERLSRRATDDPLGKGTTYQSIGQPYNTRNNLSSVSALEHYQYMSYIGSTGGSSRVSDYINYDKVSYFNDEPMINQTAIDTGCTCSVIEPEKLSFEDFMKETGVSLKKVKKEDLSKMKALYKQANDPSVDLKKADKSWENFSKLVDKYIPKPTFETFAKDLGIDVSKVKKKDLDKMKALFKFANDTSTSMDKADKAWDDLLKLTDKYMPKPTFKEFAKDLDLDVSKINKADLDKMKALFKSTNDSSISLDKADKAWTDLFQLIDKYIPAIEV